MADIKIAMLAPKNSGKTCYLVAMYGRMGVLNRKPTEEHGLIYEFLDKKQESQLSKKLKAMARPLFRVWPKPSDTLDRYQLKVQIKNGTESQIVELIDFPGRDLNEIEEENSRRSTEVYGTLAECNAFIILLSAEHIQDYDEIVSGEDMAVTQIDNVITRAIDNKKWGSIGVPIVFCISKVDLLESGEREEAKDIVRKMFPKCFAKEYDHPVNLTGVTLGTDIQGKGKLSPQNMEAGMLFALCYAALAKKSEQEAIEWDWQSKLGERKQKNIFVRFWKDMTSEHTEYQLKGFADKHGENASKADIISDKAGEALERLSF